MHRIRYVANYRDDHADDSNRGLDGLDQDSIDYY